MVGGGQGSFIGGVHRIAATLDQQTELVAGCFSRDPENTRVTAKQLYLDPTRCYAGYVEMADVEARLPADRRIDFVSIVTPNVSHFSMAKTFLDAGFHVVCDKPMTYALAEAEQLVPIVERSGLVFALTHNYTGYPLVRHARELFRSGQMGAIRKVIVEYLQDALMLPLEKHGQKQISWRVDPAQSGIAGALADVGTHSINLLEYVTGDRVSELCADKSTFLPDRILDEDANLLVRLRGGGKGVITLSQVATGEENALRLRVYAADGAIGWDQENPNYLHLYRPGAPRQSLTRGRAEYLSAAAMEASRVPTGHTEGYFEAFATVYGGIFEAIRRYIDGQPLSAAQYGFPTVYDGVRGMQFIYKAVESAEAGSAWVSL